MTIAIDFTSYLDREHHDLFFNRINSFIIQNRDDLDVSTGLIDSISFARADDIHFKFVNIIDTSGSGFDFDVAIVSDIEIGGHGDRDYETDCVTQWFRLSCSAKLDDGLKDLRIHSVGIYARVPKPDGQILSSMFRPIIEKVAFDDIAESFLARYYPRALQEPLPLPVRDVAQAMDLSVMDVRITKNLTIFGMMAFGDCTVVYYDDDWDQYLPLDVSRGTILVDPNVFFQRNIGCLNNTIIHECVHWFLHKKYHEFKKLYDIQALLFSCRVNETMKVFADWSDEDWVEWQANGIAPRILMPEKTTRFKIKALISELETLFPESSHLDILELVIDELAGFFQVSKTAAKIRLLDLGYKEAENLYNFIDGHYVESLAFPAGSKDANQDFSIGISDAFNEYQRNEDFKRLLDSGNFFYIDSRYVINDPLYIERTENGGLALTDYARQNPEECFIRFDLELRKEGRAGLSDYYEHLLFRSAEPGYNKIPTFNPNDPHNLEVFEHSEELQKFQEKLDENLKIRGTQLNYAQLAATHIKRKGYNKTIFYEKTLLSGKTFDRIMTNTLKAMPKIESVMAVCIGLELGAIYGLQLLEVAGYKLSNLPIHCAYHQLLVSCCGKDIFECNEILIKLGFEPILGREYREYFAKIDYLAKKEIS